MLPISESLVSEISSSPLEDQSRQSIPLLLKSVEIDCLAHHEQSRALHTLERSVRVLLESNPGAVGLTHMAKAVQDARVWVSETRQNAQTAVHSPTAKAAVTQPATSLPLAAHRTLLSCWGLIVYASWVKGIQVPEDLSSGWRKLAEGKLPDWKELARQPINHVHGIDAAIPETKTSVVKDFLQSLRQLSIDVSFTSMPAGTVHHVPTHAEPLQTDAIEHPIFLTETARSQKESTRKDQDDHPSNHRETIKAEPFAEVDGHFIGWQQVQAAHLPALDGYALPLRWDALHPLELLHCCSRLTQALKSADNKQSLTAAACLTALIAGLPPQLLLQVHFGEHGDTWIDTEHRCVKRNLGAIAIRKDKTAETGVAPNWRSIPQPPEVNAILRSAIHAASDIHTVGDLCLAYGISLRSMHDLLNEGDQTSHRPELGRFARSLGLFLVDAGVSPTLAAQASADWSLCPPADHYYFSGDDQLFVDPIGIFCRAVGLAPPAKFPESHFAGSPYCPAVAEVRKTFERIADDVFRLRVKLPNRSRPVDYVDFQNQYQLACATLFVLATGHRGSRLEEASWDDIDLEGSLAMITDKESDEYSARRIVPLIGILNRTLRHLWSHQQAVTDHIGKLQSDGAVKLNADAIWRSRNHLFFQFKLNRRTDRYYAAPVDHEDLATFLRTYTARPVNLGRHFGFTELVREGVAPAAINAWTGRHSVGAEPFGLAGSLSPRAILAYLMPELEKVFAPAGLVPLVGLGSARERDLKPPPFDPPLEIERPVNDYLQSRLDAEDLLPFEIMHTQRCPFMPDTLVASRYVEQLRRTFLKSDLSGIDAGATVLFSLTIFDSVVNKAELSALYEAAFDHPQRVGSAAFVEAQRSGVVIASRQISPVTVACLGRLYEQGATVSRAWLQDSMVDLLRAIDPTLSLKNTPDLLDWLMCLASHWLLIHAAPTEQFPVFAGARSLSAEDVARSISKRPAPEQCLPAPPRRARKKRGWNQLIRFVRHFSNRSARLGETRQRKRSLARVVALLKESLYEKDSGLYWACAWVISECLTPPSNPIKVGTIYSYLNILEKFFNGSIALSDLDPEDWIIMREAMLEGRSPDTASDVEGALLHLGCFMRSLGFDVPAFFLRNQPKLTQVPLRQPVVVFLHEAEKAASLLSQLEAPWTASAIEKLRLMAHVGVRPIEATNLAVRDVGIHGQLIHITTAGFDHLKTTHSRGSVTITDPQLQRLLEKTGELRRAAALPSEMPLLFREEGVDATPEINAAILWALRQATGKARLTLRDLRASAITRSIAPIEELLGALTTSLPVHGDCNRTEDIRRKSISMALAIRRARHSISFPTTQRHYDAGGAIRLAVTLRQHEAQLELGSDFIAAVTGKTKAAVEVARHRAGISISDVEKSWKDFIGILRPHFSKFAEPALAESIPVGTAIPRAPAFESAGWSLMLWQYGLDDELIAHVTGVTEDSLKRQVLEIERALGYPLARDRAAIRSRELPTILSSIPARKFWRELISHRSDFVKGGRFLFGRQTLHGALDMPSQVAACEAATLLTRCVPSEWKVAIVAPPSYELERRAALRQSLTALDIHLETRKSSRVNGWTVRVDPADGSRFAPRAVGEITKYVLRGALVASFF